MNKLRQYGRYCWGLFGLCLLPTLAFAASDNVTRTLENLSDWLSGDLAIAAATLAVAGSGFLCFNGKIPWSVFINILIGLAIVFSAGYIAGLVAG